MMKFIRKIYDKSAELILNEWTAAAALSLYMVIMHLEFSYFQYVDLFELIAKAVRYLLYLVMLVRMILIYVRNKEMPSVLMLGMFLLGIVITVLRGDRGIVILLLFVYGLKDIDFNKILNIVYHTHFAVFISLVCASLLGIIPNWSIDNANRLRYFLGYRFATIPTTYFFIILVLQMVVRREKIKASELMMDTVIAVLLYSYTDSRTGMFLSMIVIACMLYLKLRNKLPVHQRIADFFMNNKVVRRILYALCWLTPVMIYGIIILVIIKYNEGSAFAIKINSVLSSRIYYSSRALSRYGVPLLGKNITWYGWGGYGYVSQPDFEYNYIDISYLSILYNKGLIMLVLYMCMISLGLEKTVKENDFPMLAAMILILMWAMIEPNLLAIEMNIFTIYIFRASEEKLHMSKRRTIYETV